VEFRHILDGELGVRAYGKLWHMGKYMHDIFKHDIERRSEGLSITIKHPTIIYASTHILRRKNARSQCHPSMYLVNVKKSLLGPSYPFVPNHHFSILPYLSAFKLISRVGWVKVSFIVMGR
jgi:hypothetical protein